MFDENRAIHHESELNDAGSLMLKSQGACHDRKAGDQGSGHQVYETCSDEDTDEAAADICAHYNIDPPVDAWELAQRGLDAVADYIASDAGDDLGDNAKVVPGL